MRPSILALGLALLGIGLVIGAFVLGSFNAGSCPEFPANPTPPMFGHSLCDHTMTIGGITFWIGATSEEIAASGALVLISSFILLLYGVVPRKAPVSS